MMLELNKSFSQDEFQKQSELLEGSLDALLARAKGESPYQSTLELLLQLFGSPTTGTIWEFHDNSKINEASYLTLEAAYPQKLEEYSKHCLPRGKGLIWKALKINSEKFQIVDKLTIDQIENKELFPEYEDRAVVLVRINVENKVYGAACLVGVGSVDFSLIKPAFEVFEKILALEIRTRKLDKRQSVLENVQQIIPAVRDSLERACEKISENVRQLIQTQGCSIFLKESLDSSEKMIRLFGSSVDPDYTPSREFDLFKKEGVVVTYRVGKGSITGYIAYKNKPKLLNSVSMQKFNSAGYREIADQNNDAWMGGPIRNHLGECIGVIRCTGKIRFIEEKKYNYVFDKFDSRVLGYIAEIISPIFEAIITVSKLDSINKRLSLSERIREHELKAPLASIVAQASFVKKYLDEKSATTKRKRLDEIISDAEMAAFLLKEARVPEPKSFWGNTKYLSPRVLVKDAVMFLNRLIIERSDVDFVEISGKIESYMEIDHFMTVVCEGSAPNTMLNHFLIQRAFYNLGLNAIKYGVKSGKLTIKLGEDARKNTIIIDFIDDGIGIDADDVPFVFDDEYRGRNAPSKASGEGLGLAIAKEIISAHGGRIEIKNNRSPTWVRISLPIKKPARFMKGVTKILGVERFDEPM